MLSQSPSESKKYQLTSHLQASGALQTPSVANAFLTIPRELFIETFYERDGKSWKRVEKTSEEWLESVYRDSALTTALNKHDLPRSSSSQPSIMAAMLEALDIQPGHQILEIGTGTGYNAALLAQLTQDPAKVTTIEIDAQMEGSLQASGFLVIRKDDTDTAVGAFWSIPLSFMAMHAEAEEVLPYPTLPPDSTQWPWAGSVRVEASDPLPTILQDRKFLWFLQWAWPQTGELRVSLMSLPEGKQALRIRDPTSQSLLFLNKLPDGSWAGRQRGGMPLWQKMQQLYLMYQLRCAPEYEAFRVALNEQRAALTVDGTYLRDLYPACES